MFRKTILCPRTKLFIAPIVLRHSDHGRLETTPFQHRLQRRENLFVSQIAGCPEKDQGVRMGNRSIAVSFPLLAGCLFQAGPPNPKRIADNSLS